MLTITKPLLAVKADLEKIRFPVMASVKLDGVRCLKNGGIVSRKFKPIPNNYVRRTLSEIVREGMDGELLLKNLTAPFREVSSAVMSRDGEPDFVYALFDWVHPDHGPEEPFKQRYLRLYNWWAQRKLENPDLPLIVIQHPMVHNIDELLRAHREATDFGFEGTMVRDPEGPYKFGRSTVKQGILLKVKNFADEEAEIIGFEEAMHNTNEATKDAVGNTKRSSAKEGLVGKGTLGALKCRFDDGTEFGCGSGFTDTVRQWLWNNQADFLGKHAKIKHQPDSGGRPAGQAPRFPVFLGFREMEIDS